VAGEPRAILVTGVTGHLGGLAAAGVLARTEATLLLAHRPHHDPAAVAARVAALARAGGFAPGPADLARLVPIVLPAAPALADLVPVLRRRRTGEIIHCAACLDYFDTGALEAANVALTRALLAVAAAVGVERFVHISTAFSAGYVEGPVREVLHGEPAGGDPTEYTRTKRAGERIVAEGGVPWLIVRPSIVIGSSRDGRYDGKAYGLYQTWEAASRLLTARYAPVLHVHAPREPCHLLPQDAFVEGLLAARRSLPPGSIVNLVSRPEAVPTVRDVWRLFVEEVLGSREVHFYERAEDVPRARLDRGLRLLLEFAAVNFEIAGRGWRFERAAADRLGVDLPDATTEVVRRCLRRFVAGSPRAQAYLAKFAAERAEAPWVFEA
jgi:nucleoside-diphosphate-sugar epimerase